LHLHLPYIRRWNRDCATVNGDLHLCAAVRTDLQVCRRQPTRPPVHSCHPQPHLPPAPCVLRLVSLSLRLILAPTPTASSTTTLSMDPPPSGASRAPSCRKQAGRMLDNIIATCAVCLAQRCWMQTAGVRACNNRRLQGDAAPPTHAAPAPLSRCLCMCCLPGAVLMAAAALMAAMGAGSVTPPVASCPAHLKPNP
jgi:hypothetical protein